MKRMFGEELQYSSKLSRKGKLVAALLGHTHLGHRQRFLVNLRRTTKLLGSRPLRILEVGSSQGLFCFWLARHFPRHQIVGLDIESDLIRDSEQIRDRLRLENCSFLCHDAARPFPSDAEFDLAYCVHTLDHILEDTATLANIFAVLRPGGTLMIQIAPFMKGEAAQTYLRLGHFRPGYSEEELSSKVRGAGFEIDTVSRANGPLSSWAYRTDHRLASIEWPFTLNVPFFPILLGLTHLDSLITKTPKEGGWVLIAHKPS